MLQFVYFKPATSFWVIVANGIGHEMFLTVLLYIVQLHVVPVSQRIVSPAESVPPDTIR